MRSKPELAIGARFRDAAEESAFVGVVHRCVHLADAHRSINGPISPAVIRNGDLACSDLDVLVAGDLVNLHFTRKHSDRYCGFLRDFDSDLHAVIVPHVLALDFELSSDRIWREPQADATRIVGIPIMALTGDVNRLRVRTDDLQSSGARIDAQNRS